MTVAATAIAGPAGDTRPSAPERRETPRRSEPVPAATTTERRPVAIIDLVGDEEAGRLARALGERLVRNDQLAPLVDPAVAAALIGPVLDEDSAPLDAARRALVDAGDALARFELGVAAARARAGQAELHTAQPTAAAIALYADLAFTYGQAKLADGDAVAAHASFLLTQRLAPERKLDPARYLPMVISAYEVARRVEPTPVPLQIRGQGPAYLDGVHVGNAPLTVEVQRGPHVVHLFGPTRLARGMRIDVAPNQPAMAVLPDARAAQPVLVARARRLLAHDDITARAGRLLGISRQLGASDVILIARGPNGLMAQPWSPTGFGAVHDLSGHPPAAEAAVALLHEVAPPRVVDLTLPIGPVPAPEPAWYQKRWVQASLVSSALAIVAAAVIIGSRDEPTVGVAPPGFAR